MKEDEEEVTLETQPTRQERNNIIAWMKQDKGCREE
jgi:hypothetical protein